MGVQTTDDEILQLNKRGHSIDTVKQAMHRMRQYGFKISMHLMPGLYGSSIEKDIQTFKEIFADPSFKPDELKVYPTSVIPNTQLYTLYQQGNYTPITTAEILQIIREAFQNIIPPYTRIKRLIRDIPATEISAGSSITNLSQLAHETMLREYKKALNTKVIASESRNITGEAKQSRNGMDCRVVSLRSTPRNDVVKFYSRLYENTDILKTEIIN
jgi:elongator complex protein 3